MGDAEGSEFVKLVATCVNCGARLEAAHDDSLANRDPANQQSENEQSANQRPENQRPSNLCAQCSADGLNDGGEANGDDESEDDRSTLAPADKPLHDPDVPEEYEIIAKFADCKNGRAYRVRDKSLGKELIIRFFTAGVARSTGGLPIESVARLLVAQNHPNLQTVYNWLPERGTNCLILDTVPEITVESVIKNEGFFDLGRAIDIFIEVCEGIEELHKQGMIHGFIRPRTIGISVSDTGVDTAKVTNFSIANAYSNVLDQPLKIGRNYTCHDSFYMSPEEIDGKVVDRASDVYSLGCVLFHAITGKPVYRGKEVRDVLEQHLGSAPARFRKRYEIPENVESVVLHMLEKDPLARYKSIRSVRVDLQRIRDKKQPIIENIWRKFFGMFGGG